jgi:hypothetical protein
MLIFDQLHPPNPSSRPVAFTGRPEATVMQPVKATGLATMLKVVMLGGEERWEYMEIYGGFLKLEYTQIIH